MRRWGLRSVGLVLALVLVCAGVLYGMIGQTLRAPDWLRDRIEARIERSLEGMQITFGDMRFVLREGWRPKLALSDMTLQSSDGAELLHLADVSASLAMRPLLQGKVQPKTITLTGAFATLRRDAQGAFSLSFGDLSAPVNSAANLPKLVESFDTVLSVPILSALRVVEMQSLTLRYEDARQGRGWTLDGGHVRLDREADDLRIGAGFSVLSGTDYASTVEANYASRIGSPEASFGISVQDIAARDIAGHGVALAWLDVLRAPISGALRGGVDDRGLLAPLSATLQIGAGVLQPTDSTRPIPFEGARSYFTYRPIEQLLVFDELSVKSAWGSGSIEGQAFLGGVDQGKLKDLIGQFNLTDLRLNPNDLYQEPVALDRAVADFRLELDPFRFSLGQMQIAHKSSQISLDGSLVAQPEGWALALNGLVDEMAPEELVQLWPERAATKARDWVARNLSGGTLNGLDFALRLSPGARPDIFAGFDYSGASIKFLRTMPPITGASGMASLVGGRFVTTAVTGQVDTGETGVIDVAGTSFIIPDVGIRRAAPGVLRLTGQGPVPAVMNLLNRRPLEVLKGTPLPVALAEGQAQVKGTLSLPLKDKVQFDEIKFHLDGTIREVTSDVLVPGYRLSSKQLQISGDQSGIEINGAGQIADVTARVSWRQAIGKGVSKASRVQGEVDLSPKVIDTFGIGLPDNMLAGQGVGQFTLDLAPGRAPLLALTSDLKGLRLRVPELGWSKPATTAGELALSATLGARASVDDISLNAAGLRALGRIQNSEGGGLERALFRSVRVGGWLDAQVEMIGRGGSTPEIRVLGGTLDMRKADFDSGGSSGGGGGGSAPLSARLDRLQITDTIALTGFEGTFETTGGLNGPFRGKVNGQAEVSGRVLPRGGRSAVQLSAKDAGGVFRSAGILSQGRGGDMTLTLLPVDRPGQFDGTLRVTNTRVKDAPAIAALVNSISLIGLFDEMAGQGIQFTEVDARFRLGPRRLTLLSSSAVGPSIGLSMDGIFDVPTGKLNMQGVISPIYLLNGVGAILTRKGEGVIGFNYRLKGTSQSPSVSVNPLSALTPGGLRDIFRAPSAGRERVPTDKPRSSGNADMR